MKLGVSEPTPISIDHETRGFDSGEPTLDQWLARRALVNEAGGASRTFVVVDIEKRVLAYYAMATGAVAHAMASGSIRRNLPEPIPVLVLGRLAVDRREQGRGLGGALLQDALHRALAVSQQVGVRALLVHALHEPAKQFYEHYGFSASPVHPLTLMLGL